MKENIFYKRNLPHYQPDDVNYFVTFRLAGSLPNKFLIEYNKEKEFEELKLNSIKNLEIRKSAK